VRVDWAIPCRFAKIEDGLVTIVGAQIDTLQVPELPARVSTWVAMRLVFSDDEAGEAHDLSMRLFGPDLVQAGELRASIRLAEPNPLKPPGWEGSHVMANLVQFEASGEGTHTVEVYLGERHQRTLPFSVRRGPAASD